jgi:hypothetical protein
MAASQGNAGETSKSRAPIWRDRSLRGIETILVVAFELRRPQACGSLPSWMDEERGRRSELKGWKLGGRDEEGNKRSASGANPTEDFMTKGFWTEDFGEVMTVRKSN